MQEKGSQIYEDARQYMLSYFVNYFHTGYKYIKIKQNPTEQESKYLRNYENMFLSQCTGVIFMAFTGYYFLKYFLKRKVMDERKLNQHVFRMTIVSAVGFGLTAITMRIQKKQKVMEKTLAYDRQVESIIQSITPLNIVNHKVDI